MYNRLYNPLIKTNIPYSKQFGFRKGRCTEHAIIQLIDQINNNFEKNELPIGVFIDLSKAFDTVVHLILLRILIHYGINSNNIHWFESYLTNRKQFISFNIPLKLPDFRIANRTTELHYNQALRHIIR